MHRKHFLIKEVRRDEHSTLQPTTSYGILVTDAPRVVEILFESNRTVDSMASSKIFLVLLFALIGAAFARPGYLGGYGLGYHGGYGLGYHGGYLRYPFYGGYGHGYGHYGYPFFGHGYGFGYGHYL